jgi:hypothetical protein
MSSVACSATIPIFGSIQHLVGCAVTFIQQGCLCILYFTSKVNEQYNLDKILSTFKFVGEKVGCYSILNGHVTVIKC